MYITRGTWGHDWTHTNTDQDARRGVNPERRIDMMGELVISLWPYAGDFRRPGKVLSINRGVQILREANDRVVQEDKAPRTHITDPEELREVRRGREGWREGRKGRAD